MVTALIIRTISSNLALSLGMVGALSIVRFRTAVKEPIDTGFMFWGITAGIMAGAGLYLVSVISSLALGLLFFFSYVLGYKLKSKYLLIVKCDLRATDEVNKLISRYGEHKLRSKSVFRDNVELTFDISLKDEKDNLVEVFNRLDGVTSVSLISYQNDFGA
jgi:uncharacterized membrane protein YhiD involved in acid resistance